MYLHKSPALSKVSSLFLLHSRFAISHYVFVLAILLSCCMNKSMCCNFSKCVNVKWVISALNSFTTFTCKVVRLKLFKALG